MTPNFGRTEVNPSRAASRRSCCSWAAPSSAVRSRSCHRVVSTQEPKFVGVRPYFVLTSPGYANGGKTVLGTFVGLQATNTAWSTGAWNPNSSTAYTVELTG